MTEVEKLARFALNPTAYGDSVKIVVADNGGMILTPLDEEHQIVLDPDQVRELALRLSIDPHEASKELATLLMGRMKEAQRERQQSGGSTLWLGFILLIMPWAVLIYLGLVGLIG